jgi:hypothetical protein
MPILTLKITRANGEIGSSGQNHSVARMLTAAAQAIASGSGKGYADDPAGYCSWKWFDDDQPKSPPQA